jgi:hypothetical protein
LSFPPDIPQQNFPMQLLIILSFPAPLPSPKLPDAAINHFEFSGLNPSPKLLDAVCRNSTTAFWFSPQTSSGARSTEET